MVPTVEWKDGAIRLLRGPKPAPDSSRIPGAPAIPRAVAQAIRELKVRGAPAIGAEA